ncbi:MAG TPA: hypothetical protein VNT53_04450 [Pseudolysinimonas sp.]|nr:hypothetical protein [Pseudolysinimonas sp.]
MIATALQLLAMGGTWVTINDTSYLPLAFLYLAGILFIWAVGQIILLLFSDSVRKMLISSICGSLLILEVLFHVGLAVVNTTST